MGIYVSVRGWLECDEQQLAAIGETPRRHVNWTHYVFFGADMRESALDR